MSRECWPRAALLARTPRSIRAAIVAVSAVTLPLLVIFFLLSALLFIDTTADLTLRGNLLCTPHGRVAAGMVLCRTAIALIYALAFKGSPWAPALINVVLGTGWLGAYFWFLPFHRQWLNRAQAAAACVFIVSAACSVLSIGLFDGAHNAAAITWVALLPLSAFVGDSMAAGRFRAFGTAMELSSPYLVQVSAGAVCAPCGGCGRCALPDSDTPFRVCSCAPATSWRRAHASSRAPRGAV